MLAMNSFVGVTGKKSTALVGQVYDMLNKRYHSTERQHKPEPKQTLKVLPIINRTPTEKLKVSTVG